LYANVSVIDFQYLEEKKDKPIVFIVSQMAQELHTQYRYCFIFVLTIVPSFVSQFILNVVGNILSVWQESVCFQM